MEHLDSAGLAVRFAHAHHLELIVNPMLAPVIDVSGPHELRSTGCGPVLNAGARLSA